MSLHDIEFMVVVEIEYSLNWYEIARLFLKRSNCKMEGGYSLKYLNSIFQIQGRVCSLWQLG